MQIPLTRPWITEEEAQAAYDVVKSCWLVQGPRTREFEEQFAEAIECKHALAINSGSSALLVSQMALGIGPGDEVIVPDMTFIATASSCLMVGATPVFCDIQLDHYGIDYSVLESLITPRTKAIIPVHYAGQSCDMDKIMRLAQLHNLYIIEDAAEAHLVKFQGQKVGTFGELGIFSFTPSKLMTTGEGGMIVTNDDELAEQVRLVRNFGDKSKFSWTQLGFNFRMPEIMGAIGSVQLKKLPTAIQKRREVAHEYTEHLSGIEGVITPYERNPQDVNYQLYTIRLNPEVVKKTNHQVISEMALCGVQTRLYYPCLHTQPVFKSCQSNEHFESSERFQETALSLPIYVGITSDEISYITENLDRIVSKS